MRAYILVQVDAGALARVASEVTGIKGTLAASAVTGPTTWSSRRNRGASMSSRGSTFDPSRPSPG